MDNADHQSMLRGVRFGQAQQAQDGSSLFVLKLQDSSRVALFLGFSEQLQL